MNFTGLKMIDADSFDQVKGLCIYPLVTEEYRKAFEEMTQAVFKGDSRTLEFKITGLKGRPLWLFSKAVPLRNEKGEVESMLSVTVDITERKNYEAEREKLIHELQDALSKVKLLSGIIPICSYCKKIRNDKGYWEQMELYIRDHSLAEFSHGMCDDCAKKAFEELDRLNKKTDL